MMHRNERRVRVAICAVAAWSLSACGGGTEAPAHTGSLIERAVGGQIATLQPPSSAGNPRERALRSGKKTVFDGAAALAAPSITGRSPPGTPDAGFVKECMSEPAASHGHTRNRFEWCARREFVQMEIDRNGILSGFIFPVIYIAYGRDDGQRDITLFMRPAGPVKIIGSYHTLLQFGIRVECGADMPGPGCAVEGSLDTRTFAEWNYAFYNDRWTSWKLKSDEAASRERSQVLFHAFRFTGVSHSDRVASSPQYAARCDSADYFPGRPKACIFWDVLPHLQYALYNANGSPSPVHGVAKHIKFAFDNPAATFPTKQGKFIPGQYTGTIDTDNPTYLERIPYGSVDWRLNAATKTRACMKEGEFADTGLPVRPVPDVEECDEFPFASTKQGAAHSLGHFSVRAVPATENGKAGTALQDFYRLDRILYDDLDHFFVEILDGRTGGGGGGGGVPVDNIAPTTGAIATPANLAGWNNTDIRIAFTANDPGTEASGIARIHVNLSGAQNDARQIEGGTGGITIDAEGVTHIVYFAVDKAGNSEAPRKLTVKVDKTPPLISGLPAQPCILWPPNHKMVQVATVGATDITSGVLRFDVVATSTTGVGPSQVHEPDTLIVGSGIDPRLVHLRPEKPGRVYQVSAQVTDVAGNTANAGAPCIVKNERQRVGTHH